MRKLICFICFFIVSFSLTAQTKFTINYNQGFGSLPTFTNYSEAELSTVKQSEDLFKYIKDQAGVEWKYSYAGCEKRAHAVSLLLKEKKVKHYKIWNFDARLTSLFNKSQKPTAKSKAGLSSTVTWPYHVAILIFVKDDKEIKPMVIDPALGDTILTQEKWLGLQNAPTSYYIYLDPQWYNYATTDKFKYYCNNIAYPFPPCMDGLLTGDFFLNDDISLREMWVEEALAVNEIAMKIINDVIKKEPQNSNKKKAFVELVENFDSLTNTLKGSGLTDTMKPYADILIPYQAEFVSIRARWKTKLNAARQK